MILQTALLKVILISSYFIIFYFPSPKDAFLQSLVEVSQVGLER